MRRPDISRSRIVAIAVLSLVAAACGGDAEPSDGQTPTTVSTLPEVPLRQLRPPVDYAGFRTQVAACEAETPPEITPQAFASPEDMGVDPSTRPVATITTSCGDIVVELDPSIAPVTVNSFVFLASQGYFDGTVSHRVAADFVIQAGDPTATGTGGPGYVIADEFPESGFVYARGVVAMANRGPGTTGSQFFIMLADAALAPQFSVFGSVVSGFDVLDTIAALPVGPSPGAEPSVPLQTVYLERVEVDLVG